jgi:hypothetical protein
MFSTYNFDQMTNINNDATYLTQNMIQNTNICNYRLQNHFNSDCTMQTQIDLATSQPGIMYQGGKGLANGGCNVDDNSKLTIGMIQETDRNRLHLKQRPYLTVPYIGKGTVDPVIELNLRKGISVLNRKTINNFSENSYIHYQQTPLLPQMKQTVSNPQNQLLDDSWIRGGLSTRDLERDSKFHSNSS